MPRETIHQSPITNHKKMNILYLHGFGSSGQSNTVEYLKKALPDYYDIEAPDIPVDPAEALPFLRKLCEKEHFSVIIGTSMGAMYAQQLPADFMRICVNPALHLSQLTDILKPGTFDFFQPRKDGQTQFTITEEIIQHFREMEEHQFDNYKAGAPENLLCMGLFGTEDTTVNCREEFQRYYPNVQTFEGGHRMNQKVLKNVVVPIIKRMEECCREAGHNPTTFDKVLSLAKFGLPEAQCFVGEYYMYHNHEAGHKEQAENWLRLSADQHYPPAELALGEWLYYGRHSFKTDPECEQWLLLAAEHRKARACYFLGKLEKDKGDMAEACQWWLKGSEGNDEWSQCELAFCYETAQGVPYDLDAAIAWYKRAALHEYIIGNADVCYQIAVLKKYAMEKFADLSDWASDRFWEGEKEMLRGNLAEAVSLWRWTPDPRAMVMEAWQMLHVVEGVVEKEGDEYFDDEMFFEEEEVAIETVAKFFSKQKHPAAYYLMGYLYEYNICYIKKDMAKARHWYGKAAAAGDEVAAWKLKRLEEEEDDNKRR